MSYKLVAVWYDRSEFEEVYKGLFYGNLTEQKYALERINVWKSRGSLPVALESTRSLLSVVISQSSESQTDGDKGYAVRNAYSLAIIRFINHITEKDQVKQYIQPIQKIAGKLGVPQWIVNLRHDATHGSLPSMDLLETAAQWCLQWLKEEYWDKQIEGMSNQQDVWMGQDNRVRNEVKDFLDNYQKLNASAVLKKRGRSKLTQLMKKLEVLLLAHRETFVTVLAEHINHSANDKQKDVDSLVSLWNTILQMCYQNGLSLLLLKCLEVNERTHPIISSVLCQFAKTGLQDKIVQYLDFLLSSPHNYSVMSLLQHLDLHFLLPVDKAVQLTRILSPSVTEKQTGEKIYDVQDLMASDDTEEETFDSSWKRCTDYVDWSQVPIGNLPEGSLTYNNLTTGISVTHHTLEENVMDTVSEVEETNSMECTDHTELQQSSSWSSQDLDKIQSLIHIL